MYCSTCNSSISPICWYRGDKAKHESVFTLRRRVPSCYRVAGNKSITQYGNLCRRLGDESKPTVRSPTGGLLSGEAQEVPNIESDLFWLKRAEAGAEICCIQSYSTTIRNTGICRTSGRAGGINVPYHCPGHQAIQELSTQHGAQDIQNGLQIWRAGNARTTKAKPNR